MTEKITDKEAMDAFDGKCELVEKVVYKMALTGEDPKKAKDKELIDWANGLKLKTETLSREEFDLLVLEEGRKIIEQKSKDNIKNNIMSVRDQATKSEPSSIKPPPM